jgi:hypothetical protein
VQRLLHAGLRGQALADFSAAVLLAMGDGRPTVIATGLG